MLTESCIACDADVPLSGAVHILVNPKGDEDVRDGYLCRSCYDEHVEPLLPDESAAADESEESGAADGPAESEADADRPDDVDDPDDRPLEEA